MRITSKGQVAIPQEIRDQCGLLPHTQVRFVDSNVSLM
jgi:AbrB family looped-hinge helix DNA binding protein